jgi:signal peptidase I
MAASSRPYSSSIPIQRFSLSIIVGVVIVLLLAFVEVVHVSGNSMNPTLQNGQFLLTTKHLANYQSGNIIVFRPPRDFQAKSSRFIKRLVAIPGDTLFIRNDIVYLNGQILNEPYITKASTRAENFPEVLVSKGEVIAFEGFALAELPQYLKDTLDMLAPLPKEILEQSAIENVTYVGTIKLAKDSYFVLGDNRSFSASEDSRLFGAIQLQSIRGIAHSFVLESRGLVMNSLEQGKHPVMNSLEPEERYRSNFGRSSLKKSPDSKIVSSCQQKKSSQNCI